MEETREELANFSIGIDRLGLDPTSNRNKAEKNSQVARFANLSEAQLRQILAERHLLGTGENCKLPAVCLLQLHRAQRRKHYFELSNPLITSGL